MAAARRQGPKQKMRMPGIEPGSQACEACTIPLHYMRNRIDAAKWSALHKKAWGIGSVQAGSMRTLLEG